MGLSGKNTTWYLDVLRGHSRKVLALASLALLVLLIMAIVRWHIGTTFEWWNIELIEQPDMTSRLIYSAFVFISLGAILFRLHFYKLLSSIFGSDRRSYREAKQLVWVALMLAMYCFIVPAIIDLLNVFISFVYNIAILVLYLSPLIFVTTASTFTIIAAIRYQVKLKHAHIS